MSNSPRTDDDRRRARAALLAAVVCLAAVLNGWGLGRSSLWYDEVVTVRLARTDGPAELVRLLGEIDAARAPLHPLALQGWFAAFGTSDQTARAFSAVCGVVTILLVYRIGRDAFGPSTGLWAAWLAALSPLLIYYAREARMYAWLVMLTCAAWSLLLSSTAPDGGGEDECEDEDQRKQVSRRFHLYQIIGYVGCLTALAYSHPLGLLMIAALALASRVYARILLGGRARWWIAHAAAGLLAAPWIGRYLDHAPEHLSGRLSIKFLLGTPIGFIGGNFATLAGFLLLAGYGATRRLSAKSVFDFGDGSAQRRAAAPVCLLIWLTLPPLALFAYSIVAQPIFGPARYTLFTAPAYLILVASGLSRLPPIARFPLALGAAGLSIASIRSMVFDPEIKADWRAFAAAIERERTIHREPAPTVIVASADPAHNVEVETARYYLPADCAVVGLEAAGARPDDERGSVYLAVGARRGRPVQEVPDRLGRSRFAFDRAFPGLAVYRRVRGP